MKLRTVFYVDVGQMPKGKAEEYIQGMIGRYKDTATPVEQQIWLPIREGGNGGVYMEQFFLPENEWEAQTLAFGEVPTNVVE